MRFLLLLIAVVAFICQFGLLDARKAASTLVATEAQTNCTGPKANCTGDGFMFLSDWAAKAVGGLFASLGD
ncbi:unnamed protein product, partial [Mesorhabditis spiculigera]